MHGRRNVEKKTSRNLVAYRCPKEDSAGLWSLESAVLALGQRPGSNPGGGLH